MAEIYCKPRSFRLAIQDKVFQHPRGQGDRVQYHQDEHHRPQEDLQEDSYPVQQLPIINKILLESESILVFLSCLIGEKFLLNS